MTEAHDNHARGEKVKPPHGSTLTPLINEGTFYPPEEWMAIHRQHQTLPDGRPFDLLFLGDSILYGWNWTGRPEILREYFGHLRIANLAVSGDYLQHLLWRIENGNLAAFQPRVVILLIGANNLDDYEPVEIGKGVMKILNRVKRLCPDATVRLTGLFPRGREPGTPIRLKIAAVNRMLQEMAQPGRVYFDDPGLELLEADGSMTRRMFYDWCHPNVEGYRRWAVYLDRRLAPFFRKTV